MKNQTRSVPTLRKETVNDEVHPISTSEAIARWEKQTGQSAYQAKEIMLNGYYPPINIMDSAVEKLLRCEFVRYFTLLESLFVLQWIRLGNFHCQQI